MDTKASFYNLYVYSDPVAETLVGNTYVPLLQTVPLQSGELIHKEFSITTLYEIANWYHLYHPRFSCVMNPENLVKFTNGHVIVKLHFKRFGTR